MGTYDFDHDGKITGFDHFIENELATLTFSQETDGSTSDGDDDSNPYANPGMAAGTGSCLSSLLCFIGIVSVAAIGLLHLLT